MFTFANSLYCFIKLFKMKKSIFLLFVLFLASATILSAQTKAPVAQSVDQVIKMSKEKYDIGKIPQGTPYTFYMEFTNISKKPVIVENVMAGCGCTVPEKPQQPILPNKTGKVKVEYNAAAPGLFNKSVTIKLAGVDEPKLIMFGGEVVAKK